MSPEKNDRNEATQGNINSSPSVKIPGSVRLAFICWLIIAAFFLQAVWKSATSGRRDSLLFCVAAVCVIGLLVSGLHRRSWIGWWWNRYVARLLWIFSLMPLIVGAGNLAFHLLGGEIFADSAFVMGVLTIFGVYLLLPSALLWTIFYSLNAETAGRYCQVCSSCSRRLKSPLQFLFAKATCENCVGSTSSRPRVT